MSANLICTLLCDDVRVEMGGKLTIVGIYNSVIGFPPPPLNLSAPFKIALPQLCIFNRWEMEPGVQQRSVTEIFDPKGGSKGRLENLLSPSLDGGYSQEILKFYGIVFDIFDGFYIVKISCGNLLFEVRFELRVGNPPILR